MTRVDILHLTTVHVWSDNRIFHKQCKSLAADGLDVGLMAVGTPAASRIDGVKILSLSSRHGGRVRRFFVTLPLALVRSMRVRPRVLHVHDPELIPVALIHKIFGTKIVYDVHEDYPLDILSKAWIPSLLRRPVAASFSWFESLSLRWFDLVVAATPSIGARLIQTNPETVVVANYPRLSELEAPPQQGEATPRNYVVYVGYLTEIRGIRLLVAAMDSVPATLVLAGKFTEAALERDIMSRLSSGKLEFRGWIDRPDMSKLLAGAILGVVPFLPEPSHLEALPNKLFEYMAAGIPVVASDFPGWKELLEGRRLGWCFRAGDEQSLASVLREALANTEEIQARGARGKQLVTEELNWDRAYDGLRSAYGRLGVRPLVEARLK